MKVLDLFCGMGGFSLGFLQEGYRVTGYDINSRVPEIFRINVIGEARVADLSEDNAIESCDQDADIIIGGPPCRPWSVLNLQRNGKAHPDYGLLEAFFQHVLRISPKAFLMENVPGVLHDATYSELLQQRMMLKYHVGRKIICYSDYGAATSRKRLFTVGFRRDIAEKSAPVEFFDRVRTHKREPRTVGEAIGRYLKLGQNEAPDHEWMNLKTIERYEDKYRSNRFGWYKLREDAPAPSFGNVAKTYVLPPHAGNGCGVPLRALSIREVMAIMGFPDVYRFPKGMGKGLRYQMVADAVSPIFSRVCAAVFRRMLNE